MFDELRAAVSHSGQKPLIPASLESSATSLRQHEVMKNAYKAGDVIQISQQIELQ